MKLRQAEAFQTSDLPLQHVLGSVRRESMSGAVLVEMGIFTWILSGVLAESGRSGVPGPC